MMEFKSRVNFAVKIEPKPGGGFVAHSENPPFHAEGETREEVEGKVRDEVAKIVGPKLAGMLVRGIPGVHVEKNVTFSINKSSGEFQAEPSPPALVSDTSSPFDTGSSSLLSSVWKVLVIAGIAIIIWLLVLMRR